MYYDVLSECEEHGIKIILTSITSIRRNGKFQRKRVDGVGLFLLFEKKSYNKNMRG
jgi:hypothetical protein